MADAIHIEQLELRLRLGVPEAERANVQRVTVSITIEPPRAFRELEDAIENTIDYFAVCTAVRLLAESRAWKLIETLGSEIAALVIEQFGAVSVEVEVRKFILPDTAFVAVRCRQDANPANKQG